jgi:hypothetical protein
MMSLIKKVYNIMPFITPEAMSQLCIDIRDSYRPSSQTSTLGIHQPTDVLHGARILPLQILAANAFSRQLGALPQEVQDDPQLQMVTYIDTQRQSHNRSRQANSQVCDFEFPEYVSHLYEIEGYLRTSDLPLSYWYNGAAETLARDLLTHALASESQTTCEHTALSYLSTLHPHSKQLETLLLLIQNYYEESRGDLSQNVIDKVQSLARRIPISQTTATEVLETHGFTTAAHWRQQLGDF